LYSQVFVVRELKRFPAQSFSAQGRAMSAAGSSGLVQTAKCLGTLSPKIADTSTLIVRNSLQITEM
jgi:hypothetical protein